MVRKWCEKNEKLAMIIQFLQAHPEVLDKMIDHVETTSVAEVSFPAPIAAAKSTSSSVCQAHQACGFQTARVSDAAANQETAALQVLLRFLGADDNSAKFTPPGTLSWMASTPVMDHLLEQLGPSATADSQHNAAYILSGIARSHFTPLAHALAAPQFLSRLFEFAFAPAVSMLVRTHFWHTFQVRCEGCQTPAKDSSLTSARSFRPWMCA